MTPLRLGLKAKRLGARFAYRNGRIVACDLDRLPPDLRRELDARLDDVLAVVSEHSIPTDVRPSDVIDEARRIAAASRRVHV
jgi:hypothetical protein